VWIVLYEIYGHLLSLLKLKGNFVLRDCGRGLIVVTVLVQYFTRLC